ATYTYGRESVSQYNESYAGVRPYTSFGNFLPNYPVNATLENGTLAPYISPDQLLPVGNADDNMMGYSYRLCLTPTQSKQAPFPKPSNYNETNFVILQRYIDSLIATGKYPNGPPFETLVDVFSYRNYPNGDKFDMCDSATSGFTSDAINLNKGYVMKTAEERKEIEQITYDYVMGLIWYILTSSLVPEHTRTTLQRYGLCNDQWNDNNHIPPQMYVREGLRLVNDHVFTQNHIVSGQCYEDSVALGSWGYDIHVVTRTANLSHVNNEGQLVAKIAKLPNSKSGPVFEIPYTIMVPSHNQVTNLLVPVCHAATHVAYSATRVEPHFMQLGGAAGYAAAWSVLTGNVDVQKVDQEIVPSKPCLTVNHTIPKFTSVDAFCIISGISFLPGCHFQKQLQKNVVNELKRIFKAYNESKLSIQEFIKNEMKNNQVKCTLIQTFGPKAADVVFDLVNKAKSVQLQRMISMSNNNNKSIQHMPGKKQLKMASIVRKVINMSSSAG
ncbi:unnamed protein product, partial [Didymodactylos carnosus]